MKIIFFDRKKGLAKIKVNTSDDLFSLSRIVEPQDLVLGEIERKIKLGEGEDRIRSYRKKYFVKLRVEKIIFDSDCLRLQGKILEGPDELPLGSAQTLDLRAGDEFKLEKKWRDYQIKRLEAAEKNSFAPKALVCVLDDEDANLGLITASGIKHLGHFRLGLVKKRLKEEAKEKFGELISEIIRLDREMKPDVIVFASPIFWKDELLKRVKEKDIEVMKKIKLENVSTGSRRGLQELCNRGALDKIIKDSQMYREARLVDGLLAEIARNGLVEYGFGQVKKAAEAGAVGSLLVSDDFIAKLREKNKYSEFEALVDLVEGSKGEVHMIASEGDAGSRLDGLGGVAAILRYKVQD